MRINSNANPTASTLRPISKFFSISISQLLGDEPLSKERLPGTHNPTYYTSARMPIIEWDWIMNWVETQGENIKEKLQTWISTEKEVGPNSFALIISTDSFGLAFRKGSTIIVDPSQSPIDGDLILVKNETDKNILLKQFLMDGHETYMRSVNPEIKSVMPLTKSYKIIGIVIETRFSLQAVGKAVSRKEAKLQFSFASSAHLKPT
jgi:SOS-response transcriptional repressor LexA